jgi:hypothetical protein
MKATKAPVIARDVVLWVVIGLPRFIVIYLVDLTGGPAGLLRPDRELPC